MTKLSDDILALLHREEMRLFEERSRMRYAGGIYRDDLNLLIGIFDKHKIENSARLKIMRDELENSLVEEIETLTIEGHELPFFSEATLYELVGKENARAVLALIQKVKSELDGGE